MKIGNRYIGFNHYPLVIAEVGINHGGMISKAVQSIIDASRAGAECIKFQYHIPDLEMNPVEAKKIIPANADKSIYDIIKENTLTFEEHRTLKAVAEEYGLIYLCTPFCIQAAEDLNSLDVEAFKVGSGECNNHELIHRIASFKKPIILSTGMNSFDEIRKSVAIIEEYECEYALLHCTSLYPTPYDKARISAISRFYQKFPDAIIGYSDHAIGSMACYTAVAFGARIIEKHFTSSKYWEGPDIEVSVDPDELKELVEGCRNAFLTTCGDSDVVDEEKQTSKFAFHTVWAIKNIEEGEKFTEENIAAKRPGTGKISASEFYRVLNRKANRKIIAHEAIDWKDIK